MYQYVALHVTNSEKNYDVKNVLEWRDSIKWFLPKFDSFFITKSTWKESWILKAPIVKDLKGISFVDNYEIMLVPYNNFESFFSWW